MAVTSLPQTTLYPASGYYITKSGKNEFFGTSKTLSSANEILYINFRKTEIEDSHVFTNTLLQLNIVRVVGTATSITLNVYIADGEVNENTGWAAVNASGSLRGALLGTETLYLSDDNEIIYVDIDDFSDDHIYGASGKTGIIIEITPNSGVAEVKIVGLYSWDDDAGEKQNPTILLYYSLTPSSFVGANRILQAVTENSYINSDAITTNYSSETSIVVDENGFLEKRGLFKFDLSSIPPGSDVIKALLFIPRSVSSKSEGQRDFIYRILQDWDEDAVTWVTAETGIGWKHIGGYYDETGASDSYNMIVGAASNKYDITVLLQKIIGSFGNSVSSSYGFMLKGQDLIFNSKSSDDVAYIDVVYMAKKLNQPPEAPTLTTPSEKSVVSTQPVFAAAINDDNAYGATEGDDLHFRIEISDDQVFSDGNITSFSTSVSTIGWHWSALGNFSDASSVFPIPAGSYTAGISRVKFDMSETSSYLGEGVTWSWRMVMIDE